MRKASSRADSWRCQPGRSSNHTLRWTPGEGAAISNCRTRSGPTLSLLHGNDRSSAHFATRATGLKVPRSVLRWGVRKGLRPRRPFVVMPGGTGLRPGAPRRRCACRGLELTSAPRERSRVNRRPRSWPRAGAGTEAARWGCGPSVWARARAPTDPLFWAASLAGGCSPRASPSRVAARLARATRSLARPVGQAARRALALPLAEAARTRQAWQRSTAE